MRLYASVAALVLGLSLLIACAGEPEPTPAPPPTARPAPPTEVPRTTTAPAPALFRLTILHNNDGESQLVDLGSDLRDFGGVARFAAVVQREKQMVGSDEGGGAKGAVIMLSSGDNFLAGAEFTAGRRAGAFYDATAIDLIGYDAIALGNHDFDFGPEELAKFINQVSTSEPPFLSSNLDFSAEPALSALVEQGRIAERVVLEKNGEKIGIVGATTPELGVISSPRKVKINSNVAREVQAEVDKLEASGVNKIVLISHLQDVDADIALVGQLSGVDVAVAGGGDELLANECDLLIPGDEAPFGPYPIIAADRSGDPVPVITTAGHYSYLGKLVVTFDSSGRLQSVDTAASGPIRIALGDNPFSVQTDIENCKRQAEFRDAVLRGPMQREVVARVMLALDKLGDPFASSEVALDGQRSSVRFHETNQGNLMADSLLWQAKRLALEFGAVLPEVAIQNGGGIRNDAILPAGQIRELDTFDMAPFTNMVTVVEGISRDQFKEVLENAVSRAVDGDADGGIGRFAQVSGFSFKWTEAGAAQALNPDGSVRVPGTRVQKVVLDDGEVIVGGGRIIPGPGLTVAAADFLARGGDEYPFRGAPFTALGVTYQQALADYIRSPDGLGGTVNAVDYPEGGEGRITRLP